MNRQAIDIAQLQIRPLHLFHTQWALVTSGDFAAGDYNTMTIGWGALGTMWSKPFAFVAVRHSRYTYTFMQKYDSFTVTAFPAVHHAALSLLGTKSGRDGDKITESGLTPQAGQVVAAPVFAEAEIVLECRKIYADDLNPAHFLDDSIYKHYPHRDFHCIYYCEIVHVSATPKYIA
jgi:flavin reductase (DIM6/NTAB) family NADH-FMN oxidoreductase RutF